MTNLGDLRVKIYADCADLGQMEVLAANSLVRGFTTNPALMRKAGVTDYKAFAKAAIRIAGNRPISFEVFADDHAGMERQARTIREWGDNVFIKIPITNTKGESCSPVISALTSVGVPVNVTAVMTKRQIDEASLAFRGNAKAVLSIFMGRIMDAGEDAGEKVALAKERRDVWGFPRFEVLWASTREVFNIWQADACGCDIITVTPDLLAKLSLAGKRLDEFSLETVRMFYEDAQKAGYNIEEAA